MKRVLVALSVGVVLLGAAGGAAAHVTSTPAAIVISGTEEVEGERITVHAVLETSRACRADRAFEVLARFGKWTHRHVWAPGPWERVGKATSETDGAVAGTVAAPTLWSVKFKFAPADRGRRGHRHSCEGAVGGMRFDPAVTTG